MRFSSLVPFLVAAATACTPKRASYVGVDGVALGKVVIYRNGVAYYERKALVTDGKLILRVPRDRVDDFLKSLKVVDSRSGETIAVTIPRDRSSSDGDLNMVLRLPPQLSKRGESREVIMTYVTEAPAWKPSYRVVLNDKSPDGKVELESWAVIDNTSGEDWKDVLVSVGASSALSFRYDLWQVRNVDRDLLDADERLAVAPPMGQSDDKVVVKGQRLIDAPATAQGIKLTKDVIVKMPIPGRSFEGAITMAPGTRNDGVGVSVSGSSSLENNYMVDGINTNSLALGTYYGYSAWDDSTKARDPRLGGITGIVSNRGKGGAVEPGLRVEAFDEARGVRLVGKTDAKGRFRFDGLTAGSYSIKVIGSDGEATANAVHVVAGQVAHLAPDTSSAVATEEQKQLASLAKQMNALKQAKRLLVISRARTQEEALQLAEYAKSAATNYGIDANRIETQISVDSSAESQVEIVENQAIERGGSPGGGDDGPQGAMIGDSNFTSPHPMTISAGSSAMVAMLRGKTAGGEVYFYDPIAKRGNEQFAFRAVRLENPSQSALEPGPVTVYGDGRFIGEGVTDSVAAGASTIIPFALDRRVTVDRAITTSEITRKVINVERTGFWVEVGDRRTTRHAVVNRGTAPVTAVLRFRKQKGFELVAAPQKQSLLGDSHLFEVDVASKATAEVKIVEETPRAKWVSFDDAKAAHYLRSWSASETFDKANGTTVDKILATYDELANLEQAIASQRAESSEYGERSRDLNVQLVTLKAVNTKGELIRSLQDKLREINERSQRVAIAISDAQQRQMVLRLGLFDAFASLRKHAGSQVSLKP